MELGFNKIILSLIITVITVLALNFAMDVIKPVTVVSYIKNLAYVIAPFIAVAIYLRTKLSELSENDGLSLSESRRLNLILALRRSRLTTFMIGSIIAAVVFSLSPFMKSIPENQLVIIVQIMIVGFVLLFYFFALILLSLHEVEKLKEKLSQREKLNKSRDDLLQKISKK